MARHTTPTTAKLKKTTRQRRADRQQHVNPIAAIADIDATFAQLRIKLDGLMSPARSQAGKTEGLEDEAQAQRPIPPCVSR